MVSSAKLKFDQITVWEKGKRGADGQGSTADFVSGVVSSRPPLHEIAQNVGVELPDFLGQQTGGKGTAA